MYGGDLGCSDAAAYSPPSDVGRRRQFGTLLYQYVQTLAYALETNRALLGKSIIMDKCKCVTLKYCPTAYRLT